MEGEREDKQTQTKARSDSPGGVAAVTFRNMEGRQGGDPVTIAATGREERGTNSHQIIP